MGAGPLSVCLPETYSTCDQLTLSEDGTINVVPVWRESVREAWKVLDSSQPPVVKRSWERDDGDSLSSCEEHDREALEVQEIMARKTTGPLVKNATFSLIRGATLLTTVDSGSLQERQVHFDPSKSCLVIVPLSGNGQALSLPLISVDSVEVSWDGGDENVGKDQQGQGSVSRSHSASSLNLQEDLQDQGSFAVSLNMKRPCQPGRVGFAFTAEHSCLLLAVTFKVLRFEALDRGPGKHDIMNQLP